MAGSMEEETWPIEASMGIKDITRLWALSTVGHFMGCMERKKLTRF